MDQKINRLIWFFLIAALIYGHVGYTAFFHPEHFDNGRTSVEFVRGFLVVTSPVVIWGIFKIAKHLR